MIKLDIPIPEDRIRALKAGDTVLLSGVMVTARDAGHKLMVEERPEFLDELLKEGVIYHCGPVVKKEGDRWSFVAAGPTTSIREEPYQGPLMEQYGIRGVIGKGGMGPKTLEYCRKVGAVYFHAIGGAAQVLAEKVVEVTGVHMAEKFGSPEAIWEFRVERFPAVVTMDSHGGSLHSKVLEASQRALADIL